MRNLIFPTTATFQKSRFLHEFLTEILKSFMVQERVLKLLRICSFEFFSFLVNHRIFQRFLSFYITILKIIKLILFSYIESCVFRKFQFQGKTSRYYYFRQEREK